jgi:hypothetical protein
VHELQPGVIVLPEVVLQRIVEQVAALGGPIAIKVNVDVQKLFGYALERLLTI